MEDIHNLTNYITSNPQQRIFDTIIIILLLVILRLVIVNYREQKADRYATINTLPTKKLQDEFKKHYADSLIEQARRVKDIAGFGIKKIIIFFKAIMHFK